MCSTCLYITIRKIIRKLYLLIIIIQLQLAKYANHILNIIEKMTSFHAKQSIPK